MLRRKRFYVIYPEYFDSKLSRSKGRKVPLNLADDKPHLKKLMKACEVLKIEYQAQPEKSYPPFWWQNKGRLLLPIDKNNKIPKEELLDLIAAKARRFVPKKKKATEKKSSKAMGSKQTNKSYKAKAVKRKKPQAKRKK